MIYFKTQAKVIVAREKTTRKSNIYQKLAALKLMNTTKKPKIVPEILQKRQT